MSRRSCGWMSGPENAAIRIPAVKWWLAISRDVLTADLRRRRAMLRPPVSCGRVPAFRSPLAHAKLHRS